MSPTTLLPRRLRTRLVAGLLATVATGAALGATAVATAGSAAASTSSARSSAGLEIGGVKYDSDGSDSGSNRSLNGEWVRIENHSSHSKDLTGYRLHDRSGHLYVFPEFRVAAHDKVYVRTGYRSSDTAHNVYQNRGWYVWNNTGDKAYFNNASGDRVDTCSWGDGGGYTTC